MTISSVSNLSKTVLVIAGSDPSGGAGIQADLKTLTSLGVYGMTAITALTEQNTRGVKGIFEIPLDFVVKQINCCLSDIGANAIKIGMMHNSELINGVYEALKHNKIIDNKKIMLELQKEIIRTLNETGIKTKHPIEVVNWTNEEGCRFAPALMASSGFVGTVDVNKILNTKDLDGKVFKEELAKIGWNGKEKVGSQKMHCYFELHIEQGPILEKENMDIGVVTHGQGLRWLEVELIGVEQHTGTTPMNVRKDAGLVMAKIISEVNNLANNNQPNLVISVGHIEVFPNSRNVIPGKTIFSIDFRSHIDEKLKDIEAKIRFIVSKTSKDHNVKFTIKEVANYDPITFDKNCVNFIRNAAKKYNYTYKEIVSGAGHDACAINTKIPAAMIMCPCVDGISHNEAEEIKKEWALTSTNVLMHAALEAAQ